MVVSLVVMINGGILGGGVGGDKWWYPCAIPGITV